MESYTIVKLKSASLRFVAWDSHHGTISNLKAKHKRKNHATALLTEFTEFCDMGKMTLRLEVNAFGSDGMNNHQLIKFYKKFGFKVVEHNPTVMRRKPKK